MIARVRCFVAALLFAASAQGAHAVLTFTGTPMKTDFNGDGRSDILWKNTVTGEAGIWYMNGTTPTPVIVGGQPASSSPVDAIDTGGAGFADILWRTPDANYYLTKLVGSQVALTNPILVQDDPYNLWEYAGRADFNGDGRQDVLWRHADGRYRVMLLSNTTVIGTADFMPPAFGNWVALVGDLNGDGKSDLVWRNAVDNRVWISLMDGVNIVSSTEVFPPGYNWVPINIGDFNGDGKADLEWIQSIPNPSDTFIPNPDTVTHGRWLMDGVTRLAVGVVNDVPGLFTDFTRDGKADSIYYTSSNGNNLCVQVNDGLNVAGQTCSVVADQATPVLSGDFDGDGFQDILWGQNGTYGIALLNPFLKDYRKLLTPGHSWVPLGGARPLGVYAESKPAVNSVRMKTDLNGDGYPDLLFTRAGSMPMRVLMQGGTVLSLDYLTGQPAAGSQLVSAVDTTANGISDLVWLGGDGRYYLTVMNDTAIQSIVVLEPQADPAGSWTLVARGDFNGDGRHDLLWQRVDGLYRITLLSNHAITQSATLVAPSIDARISHLGDLDGDGRTDLVWTAVFTGWTWVSTVNGTAINTNLIWTDGPSLAVVTIGDFNSDGKADLCWGGFGDAAHPFGRSAQLWLMNGTTPTTVNTVSISCGGTPGDYNGDGRTDFSGHYAGGGIQGPYTTIALSPADPYGTWTSQQVSSLQFQSPVVSLDFNRDGRGDLLMKNAGDYTVVLLNGTQVLGSTRIIDQTQLPNWTYLDIR